MIAQASPTDDTVENDAVVRKLQHLAGLLVENSLDPTQHAIGSGAIRYHLDVEQQPTIPVIHIKRPDDFSHALDVHELSRLKVQHG